MKRLKISIIFSLLVAASIIVAIPAHAQLSDSLKNELRKVSAIMYDENNENFIVVDAIIDGYMLLDKPYSFTYGNNIIIINDKELTGEEYTRYDNKMKRYFFQMYMKYVTHTFSQKTSVPIRINDILNPSSQFRKQNTFQVNEQQLRKRLVLSLSKDGLIDTNAAYNILYDIHGLFINNEKLFESEASKYIAFLNNNGLILKNPSDKFEFFHQSKEEEKKEKEKSEALAKKLILLLSSDGLIDTTSEYKVLYDLQGLFINGKHLPETQATKYITFLRKNGFIFKRVTDRLEINHQNK